MSVRLVVNSWHYSDVIMNKMASQIPSLTIVYSTIYQGEDERKHQSSASLAFVRGIHRWPLNSPHKWPVKRNMFPFDNVIMDGLSLVMDLQYNLCWKLNLVSNVNYTIRWEILDVLAKMRYHEIPFVELSMCSVIPPGVRMWIKTLQVNNPIWH